MEEDISAIPSEVPEGDESTTTSPAAAEPAVSLVGMLRGSFGGRADAGHATPNSSQTNYTTHATTGSPPRKQSTATAATSASPVKGMRKNSSLNNLKNEGGAMLSPVSAPPMIASQEKDHTAALAAIEGEEEEVYSNGSSFMGMFRTMMASPVPAPVVKSTPAVAVAPTLALAASPVPQQVEEEEEDEYEAGMNMSPFPVSREAKKKPVQAGTRVLAVLEATATEESADEGSPASSQKASPAVVTPASASSSSSSSSASPKKNTFFGRMQLMMKSPSSGSKARTSMAAAVPVPTTAETKKKTAIVASSSPVGKTTQVVVVSRRGSATVLHEVKMVGKHSAAFLLLAALTTGGMYLALIVALRVGLVSVM